MAVHKRTQGGKEMQAEIITGTDHVSNVGDFGIHCILAFYAVDDRPEVQLALSGIAEARTAKQARHL